MQTFLPFLLVWDEAKTLMENLQACFRMCARLLDNKRTGKQRVEAMQLLNILLDRNPDSSWKRHPIIGMWSPWVEALKVYYNCFLEEWMARGFVNNLAMEPVDEKALEEQGVPPFIANKHFVDRHRANLMSKHPDFYKQYEWGVEPRQGYYWYLDGAYVLTKYSMRFESDLSGDHPPDEPEEPENVKRRRLKREAKLKEEEEEGESDDRRKKRKGKKKAGQEKKGSKSKRDRKEAEAEEEDDDDLQRPKLKNKKIKKEEVSSGSDAESQNERKQGLTDLIQSFAFDGKAASGGKRGTLRRGTAQVKQDLSSSLASASTSANVSATR